MKELFTGILVKHDKYGRKYAGKGRFVILQESIRKFGKRRRISRVNAFDSAVCVFTLSI